MKYAAQPFIASEKKFADKRNYIPEIKSESDATRFAVAQVGRYAATITIIGGIYYWIGARPELYTVLLPAVAGGLVAFAAARSKAMEKLKTEMKNEPNQ